MNPSEFQCILLAGGEGQGLYPLSEFIAKPLLPVANRALISYPVQYLVQNGIKDIIIVYVKSQQGMEKCIQALQAEYQDQCRIRGRCLDEEEHMDSASAVRAISDWIHSDFIIVPCDIITDLNLQDVINVHRSMIRSSVTMVMLDSSQGATDTTSSADKAKSQQKGHLSVEHYVALTDIDRTIKRGGDLIKNNALSSSPNILPRRVAFYSTSILEELKLGRSFFSKWSDVTFSDRYNDLHIYIFARWVIDLLKKMPKIHSLKHELIPYIVSKQFSDLDSEKEMPLEAKQHPQQRALQASSSYWDSSDHIRAFACIVEGKVFCKRTNTIDAYLEVNREIAKGTVKMYSTRVEEPPKPKGKKGGSKEDKKKEPRGEKPKRPPVQIGQECCVASGLELGEQITMKRCCIGAGCKMGNDVKIVNSVVMNDVIIGDNVTIQNSIVSSRVTVDSNVKIDNCKIGSGFTVQIGDYKDEVLKKEKEFVI